MPERQTQESFIAKARKIHGDKYDYSKVVYIGARYKVEIVCKEHGSFWQEAFSHSKGIGCPACSRVLNYGRRHESTDQFIAKARKIHGDKYDYSKVVYIGSKKKVEIVCPTHGSFWQTSTKHLSGHGCKKCAISSTTTRLASTTEEFIKRARAKHGDKYDYSKVVYIAAHKKVEIVCPTHGSFWQRPDSHIAGNGCKLCNTTHHTSDDFIQKARKIHGDKYDYSKVVYCRGHAKVEIICPEHGSFWQTPSSHLTGAGCKKCAISSTTTRLASTTEEFIAKARKIHGDKYDYSKVVYINNRSKIIINCKIHGEFTKSPQKHLDSQGCPKCSDTTMSTADINARLNTDPHNRYELIAGLVNTEVNALFHCRTHQLQFTARPLDIMQKTAWCPECRHDPTYPTYLYLLRMVEADGTVFYKIGVTVKRIAVRASGRRVPYNYEVLYLSVYPKHIAYSLERIIKQHAKQLSLVYTPQVTFKGGVTECISALHPSWIKFLDNPLYKSSNGRFLDRTCSLTQTD